MNAMGRTIDGIQYQKAPNKFKVQIKMGGQVFQEQIFNGEAGVTKQMGQSQPMDEAMANVIKEQSIIFPELEYRSDAYKMELKGIETVAGSDAYHILITASSGGKTSVYYDIKKGLKVKIITTIKGPQGESAEISEIQEYTEVNGIKFPKKATQTMMGQNISVEFTEMKVNGGIDDAEFKIE